MGKIRLAGKFRRVASQLPIMDCLDDVAVTLAALALLAVYVMASAVDHSRPLPGKASSGQQRPRSENVSAIGEGTSPTKPVGVSPVAGRKWFNNGMHNCMACRTLAPLTPIRVNDLGTAPHCNL